MLGPVFLPGLDPVQDALGDGHLLRVAQLQGGLLIRQPATPSTRPFSFISRKIHRSLPQIRMWVPTDAHGECPYLIPVFNLMIGYPFNRVPIRVLVSVPLSLTKGYGSASGSVPKSSVTFSIQKKFIFLTF